MTYVVYENYRDKKVRIHKESHYCKPLDYKTEEGEWHGPFEVLRDAEQKQREIAAKMTPEAKIVDKCGTCKL